MAPPIVLLVLLPLADLAAGTTKHNPGPAQANSRGRRMAYELALWLFPIVQVAAWGICLWRVSGGSLGPWELLGVTASLGLSAGGGGITVAHELMHRPTRTAKGVAELMMALVNYSHFCVEHVHGHHRNVATPHDPATARVGEGLYAFLLRSVWGGFGSARRIETQRIRRAGISTWSLANRNLRYPLLAATICGAVLATAGWRGLVYHLGVGIVAVLFLEIVNYVEHYGIERRELAPGKFERPQPQHSWNSSERVTNWLLFNLQRHSDHHARAHVPYRDLLHIDAAPQLPTGYAGMFWLAVFPPLWRRVMDPRVAAWRKTWT